jgi:hypothetical protein
MTLMVHRDDRLAVEFADRTIRSGLPNSHLR